MRNNKHYLDYKNRKWKLKQHTHTRREWARWKKWGSETFFEWERLCFFNLLLGKIGALIISHDDDGWHGSAWLRYIWQKSRGAPFKKRFKTLFNKPFLLPISMVEMVSGSDWSWTPSSNTHKYINVNKRNRQMWSNNNYSNNGVQMRKRSSSID